ncbi:kinesin-like protein KIF2A isoform X2 [Bolinopsis microptera]|uniref:kinesin-like protein KIF2A isoform X2 n=1 Tax=Bolinopsis microptera TaxID=2820187 RepID=UPI003079ABC6
MVEDVGELLTKAGLEEFLDNFKQQGFTTGESLMILTMQDYPKFGIVHTEDKRKLFQIIQQQKQSKSKDGSKRMSSVIARLTSSERKSKEKKESTPEPTPPNSTYFNRATFLRRSFNKTKGNDNEPSLQRSTKQSMSSRNMTSRERNRCASSQPALSNKKISSSASAENINNLKLNNGSHLLRKSASGKTVSYLGKTESNPPIRTRSKTTSVFTSSTDKARPTSASKVSDKIKVCVRKRPLNRREKTRNEEDVVEIPSGNQCFVYESKTSVDLSKFVQKHCYMFDRAFGEAADNELVYCNTAKPLVDWVFQGNKATCFAYGQTGSGKTYTMIGTKQFPGIVTLAARDIFSTIKSQKYGTGFKVYVSFYEIYCGQLFDLINKRKRLNALENAKKAICIVGLTERLVNSHTSVIDLVNQGGNRRSSGSTSVNAESSRSHAILQIELRTESDTPKGKFSFIDLAGSERAADVSDTSKQTRMEGAEINTSLLALKECIRALDQESKHTPFRQSKLTQVLRDSFIGNSKTCMIASISPCCSSCEDTLNTLRYADRVKELGRDGNTPSEISTSSAQDETPLHSRRDSAQDETPLHSRRDSAQDETPLHSPPAVSLVSSSPSPPRTSQQRPHTSPDALSGLCADNFPLDTSDVASDLPSDVSLLSRTDSDASSSSHTKISPEPNNNHGSNGVSQWLDEVDAPVLERSRTMASAPRARIQVSENKMKKAQEDLIGSHQIHISQVTNLCTIEAELLQHYSDGHLEFGEYLKKLETILESKNKCVESLRAQVACYSLRAAY